MAAPATTSTAETQRLEDELLRKEQRLQRLLTETAAAGSGAHRCEVGTSGGCAASWASPKETSPPPSGHKSVVVHFPSRGESSAPEAQPLAFHLLPTPTTMTKAQQPQRRGGSLAAVADDAAASEGANTVDPVAMIVDPRSQTISNSTQLNISPIGSPSTEAVATRAVLLMMEHAATAATSANGDAAATAATAQQIAGRGIQPSAKQVQPFVNPTEHDKPDLDVLSDNSAASPRQPPLPSQQPPEGSLVAALSESMSRSPAASPAVAVSALVLDTAACGSAPGTLAGLPVARQTAAKKFFDATQSSTSPSFQQVQQRQTGACVNREGAMLQSLVVLTASASSGATPTAELLGVPLRGRSFPGSAESPVATTAGAGLDVTVSSSNTATPFAESSATSAAPTATPASHAPEKADAAAAMTEGSAPATPLVLIPVAAMASAGHQNLSSDNSTLSTFTLSRAMSKSSNAPVPGDDEPTSSTAAETTRCVAPAPPAPQPDHLQLLASMADGLRRREEALEEQRAALRRDAALLQDEWKQVDRERRNLAVSVLRARALLLRIDQRVAAPPVERAADVPSPAATAARQRVNTLSLRAVRWTALLTAAATWMVHGGLATACAALMLRALWWLVAFDDAGGEH